MSDYLKKRYNLLINVIVETYGHSAALALLERVNEIENEGVINNESK